MGYLFLLKRYEEEFILSPVGSIECVEMLLHTVERWERIQDIS